MTQDPFEAGFAALFEPSRPVDPDPRFAARLRDDLRRAVLKGATMTTTEDSAPARVRSLTPYLAVADARAALDFYVEAFGAVRRGEPIVMPDGSVGHAELAIGDAVLMLAEESAPSHHFTPDPGRPPTMRVTVPDPDAAVAAATRLGAEVLRPVTDSPYGRGGSVLDPFGYRWLVSRAEPEPEPPVAHGAMGYVTYQFPEVEPAKEFYGAVLGWRFTPGRVANGWQVTGPGLMGGFWGGPGRQVGPKLMYAVDDLDAALERVRAHGGTAGPVSQEAYGRSADCVDNQGLEFWLWQV